MDRFHKWCHDAVEGLGIFCLWYEFSNIFEYFFNARAFGIMLGLFVIGWAVGYKEDNN